MTSLPAVAPSSKMLPADWDKYAYPALKTPYERKEGSEPVIDLGNGHKLHAQEFGDPKGEPVIILHGGPGGGCSPLYARYFDPKRFRIIMFDQRGCQYSTPTTHTDLAAAMKGNNTAELVEDIEAVRKHFKINGKMHVEGGSWGTTLGLAYAIKHPEHVKSLILRGVFLGTPGGTKFMFQGNAEHYEEVPQELRDRLDALQAEVAAVHKENDERAKEREKLPKAEQDALPPVVEKSVPEGTLDAWRKAKTELASHFSHQNTSEEGSYRAYLGGNLDGQINLPGDKRESYRHMIEGYAAGWDKFVRLIPKGKERKDMITAYMHRLEATADESLKGTGTYDPKRNRIDPVYQQNLAFAFAQWEGLISYYSQPVAKDGFIDLGKFADPDFAVDFARIECRYTHDGFYLTENGSPSPGSSNYLVDNLHRIAKHNIPMYISHGANDQVCPVRDAHLLVEKYTEELKKAGHTNPAPVVLVTPAETGHSMLERGNTQALLDLIRQVPELSLAEKMGPTPPSKRQVG